MPAYSGLVALLVSLLLVVLRAFGIVVGDDVQANLTSAVVSIVSAVAILIGIWRLLFTKRRADVATAQLIAAGHTPILGPVPSESDELNAAQLVRKVTS